jgi:NADH:ubiquinone reductase (H+-translocating)
MMTHQTFQHKVVILGAGFAGISAAKTLSGNLRHDMKKKVRITILNRRNYQLYTPLLYQAATGLIDFDDLAQPVRPKARQYGYEFVQTEIYSINLQSKKVFTDAGDYDYDYLVIALGSVKDDAKIPGAQGHSIPLKTLEDGQRIHNKIISSFETAAVMSDGLKKDTQLTFVVIGGSTGVELAGSIHDYIGIVAKDYPEIDAKKDCGVFVIEAHERLFPDGDKKLSEIVKRTLEERGVKLLLNSKVSSIEKDKINLADGKTIDACNIFFNAGIKPSPVVESLPEDLVKKEKNRIVVDQHLRIPHFESAYAIGDLSAVEIGGDEKKKKYAPPNAESALEEGKYVGKHLALLLNHASSSSSKNKDSKSTKEEEPFHYKERGIMLSIGIHKGIAKFPHVTFTGYTGWLIWRVVHIYFVSTRGRKMRVLIDWISDSFRKRNISQLD